MPRDDAALGLPGVGRGTHEMHNPNAIDLLRLAPSLRFADAGAANRRQRRNAKFPHGKG
jgi:hypothetical protein